MKVGSHHSEETKRKMRERANHDPRPPEICAKITESKMVNPHPYRGKTLTEEHRKNISEGMRKKQRESELNDSKR